MSLNCPRPTKESTADNRNKSAIDRTSAWSDAFSHDNLNVEDFIVDLKLAEVSRACSFKDNLGIIDSFVLINCKKIRRLSLEDYGDSEQLDNNQEYKWAKDAKNDQQHEDTTVLIVPTKAK